MPDQPAAPSRPSVLRLSPACDLGEVRVAVQTAHGFLAREGWSDDDLTSFDLALVEACNNAVKYSGPSGRNQPVGLEIISEPGGVEFRIHDHTPGFDWPEKVKLPPPDSERGRGLYLITTLMDSARYYRGRDGNLLIMRKSRLVAAQSKPTVATEAAANPDRRLAEDERVIGEMVEELSSCYESLAAIFRYSAEQGRGGDPAEFARRMLRDLLLIVEGGWFVLRLVPKGESRLVVLVASDALELPPLLFPASGHAPDSAELEAALTRKRVWFGIQQAPHAKGPLGKQRPGSVGVVHPIVLGDQLIGTLAVGRQPRPRQSSADNDLAFTAGQMNVIATFGDFLAIQIANAHFQEEQFRQRLMTHELEIANKIQRSLLLGDLPQVRGFRLAGFCRSAREVGGDFYDVLTINEHSVLLIIADVMGKGIPAALFAASLRTLLRAAPELTGRPGALLSRVNSLLFPELSGVDMFITAQLACLDADARRITLASAGHCPVAVADRGVVRTFAPEGMPLGVVADTQYHEESVELPPDCTALLYTDGLTEARNARGEQFGDQRLMEWLARAAGTGRGPEALKEELALELARHQANTVLNDDQTFLIVSG